MSLNKILILFVLGLVLLISISLEKQKKLNVILITADALRPDHMSVYGYEKNTTPFLKRFASNSLVFNDAIAQSGSTITSVPSILTSLYPFKDNLIEYEEGLPHLKANHITLPKILRRHGYHTMGIVCNQWLKKELGFGNGFDHYDDNFTIARNAREATQMALKQLNHTKKPFFLWIHYIEPHMTPAWKNFSRDYYQEFLESCEDKEYGYKIYGRFRNFSNCQIGELRAIYDRQILYLDNNLKVLFDYLNHSGLLNSTLIVFTADHAELLGEHKIFDHNNLYYKVLRVPLIVYYPGIKPKTINRKVALVDIFPTILHLTGIEFNGKVRGKDLSSDHDFIFAELKEEETIISGDYKLFRNKVFNISRDPDESTPLNKPETLEILDNYLNNLS